jgi:predicted DNA binding CopG/RHH family protein
MIKEKKINYEIDLNFKGYANPSQTIDMDTKLPAPKPLGTPSHENKFQNIKNYKFKRIIKKLNIEKYKKKRRIKIYIHT